MIKVGSVLRTANPEDPKAKPGRPAIVVFVDGPVVGLCFGQENHRDDYPHTCVVATQRLGLRLGLSKDTHFYASKTVFVDAADLPAPDARHSAPATLVADIQACEPQMDKLIRAGISRVLAARATKKQAEAPPSQPELPEPPAR